MMDMYLFVYHLKKSPLEIEMKIQQLSGKLGSQSLEEFSQDLLPLREMKRKYH